jgi:hypothetical protein
MTDTDSEGSKTYGSGSKTFFHYSPKFVVIYDTNVLMYETSRVSKSRKGMEKIHFSRIYSSQCMAVLWSWSRNYIAIAAPAPFYLSQKFY